MILSRELAQQIVDKITPFVPHNVNIMNNAGFIIGTGHSERLSSFHKGAKDAIDYHSVIEIYPENVSDYPGAMPGLNWPIILGDQIVGVVGISGHPDTVRHSASLVKMITELILERENLVEEIRSHSYLLEQFVFSLLSSQALENYSKLVSRANLLNFSLHLPRAVVVVDIHSLLEHAFSHFGKSELIVSRTVENLLSSLTESNVLTADDLAVAAEDKLIIIKHMPLQNSLDDLNTWSNALLQALVQADSPDSKIHLGIGSIVTSPLDFHHSYREAQYLLTAIQPCTAATIYDFDHLASYLLHDPQAITSCIAFKMIKNRLSQKMDFKYDMKNTLLYLLDNNLNISITAKKLFIHRNTLIFRLEKLGQHTGLYPCKQINHAILCKILCHNT